MFTIKHITLSGIQNLYQAPVVAFAPAIDRGESGAPPEVCFHDGSGDRMLQGGTIFVMNEQGATVSRYDLGASNVPLTVLDGRREHDKEAIMGERV